MTIDSSHLLKQLEPAVRPVAAPSGPRTARTPFEQQGFGDLLALVARGDVYSDRPVTVGTTASLAEPLTADDLSRLAPAGDRAEAAGATRALMLLDGRALVMDVPSRTVADELAPGRATERYDIDAAVFVTGDGDTDPNATTIMGPPSALPPPGVARQLAAGPAESPTAPPTTTPIAPASDS